MKPRTQLARTMDAMPGSEVAAVQAFVRAEARTPTAARSLADLGLAATPAFDRLAARGLLYCTPEGRWYLDVARYTARQDRRHVMEVGIIVAAAALLVWLLAASL